MQFLIHADLINKGSTRSKPIQTQNTLNLVMKRLTTRCLVVYFRFRVNRALIRIAINIHMHRNIVNGTGRYNLVSSVASILC